MTTDAPDTITSAMRKRLYGLGYPGPEINKLTPAEAHAILDAASAARYTPGAQKWGRA